jgi:hypothetical protein
MSPNRSAAETAALRTDIVFIDVGSDGLVQIAESLVGHRHLGALHVISRGGPDLLAFRPARVTAANLGAYAAKLAVTRGALSAEADILLHGCEASAGEASARAASRPGRG